MSESLVEKMKLISQKENEIKTLVAQTSTEFKRYITDQSIPLLTRWAFFIQAANHFKNHHRSIPTFKSDGMIYIRNNFFDAPEVYGRGKIIYLKDVFEDLIYEDDDNVLHLSGENFSMSYDEETNCEALARAMEEILAMNLGSFTWDW